VDNTNWTKGNSPVTLRDVAAMAGVSAMTVSNVVNGRPGTVSDDTRKRVDRALDRLNYRPHLSARGLRLAVRRSVGILIVSDVPSHISDPLVIQSIVGLSDRLQRDGFSLVVQVLKTEELERSTLVRNVFADGLCLVLAGSDTQRRRSLDLLCGLGQPVVLFQDTVSDDSHRDMCLVRQDDFGGAKRLASRVLRKGARRLTMLTPAIVSPGFQERERGFQAAVAAASTGAELTVVHCGDGSFKSAQAALAHYIQRSGVPDAVLGGNDQLGIAAIQLLTQLGHRVPVDVLVTGFNGFEIWQYSVPTLTTVCSPAYEMGMHAASEMLERLQTGKFRRREERFPVRVVAGGSA
jgi:LacI family transcriptional regulator